MIQPDTSQKLANGLVLAVNCVPEDVDPNIRRFWEHLQSALQGQGFELIIASTAPLSSESLSIIPLPFNLPDFAVHYPVQSNGPIDRASVDHASHWYRQAPSDAMHSSLHSAYQYFGMLLDALRPSAVIGWQRTHPATRALCSEATDRSIPFWSAERGWIIDTLMFDMGFNNFLSEVQCSVGITRQLQRFAFDDTLQDVLQARYARRAKVGRYESARYLAPSALKEKYGIDPKAKVLAFFNHGEPHLYPGHKDALAALHGIDSQRLQRQIDFISDYCSRHGYVLLIQEHPFNASIGNEITLPAAECVIRVNENPHSVMDVADRLLFTLSTLQFDALYSGKPFGLLSRSVLSQAKGAYEADHYGLLTEFLNALMLANDWQARKTELFRFAQFVFQDFLHDIQPEASEASAHAFATHLARFARPVDAGLPERVETFLAHWATMA